MQNRFLTIVVGKICCEAARAYAKCQPYQLRLRYGVLRFPEELPGQYFHIALSAFGYRANLGTPQRRRCLEQLLALDREVFCL